MFTFIYLFKYNMLFPHSSWWQYCCHLASEEEAESHMTGVFVPVIMICVCESQSTDGSAAAQHTLFTQVMHHTVCAQLRFSQRAIRETGMHCEDND